MAREWRSVADALQAPNERRPVSATANEARVGMAWWQDATATGGLVPVTI